MPLPLSISNGIKVYNLSAQKSQPKWSNSQKDRQNSLENSQNIELLQDFDFPSSCSTIRLSGDKKYLLATGTYKPRVKVFELSQLALKFERHLDDESIDFLALSDSYSKLCFLRRDRVLEFHTQFGSHYKTKIPKNGRNLVI